MSTASAFPTNADWLEVFDRVDSLVEHSAVPSAELRQKLACLYTQVPVGVYWHASRDEAAVYAENASAEDLALVKSAASRVGKVVEQLNIDQATSGEWIKVAYSPTLRSAGEWLNFFPGEYPGGIPNAPSPLAAMLTSGLVGAGLGYGTGWLAEKVLPENWKKGRLRKTLSVLGGGLGAAPGLVWGIANKTIGRPFNDPHLLQGQPSDVPDLGVQSFLQKHSSAVNQIELCEEFNAACAAAGRRYDEGMEHLLKEAFAGGSFNEQSAIDSRLPTSVDIDVDAMGRTLWEVGATPETAATTMGTLYAAQQMPGGIGAGWVTPPQMANLAANMGVGYLSGALVGGTLGLLTGLPQGAQDTLKRTGAYLGIVKAVVPKLFGG